MPATRHPSRRLRAILLATLALAPLCHGDAPLTTPPAPPVQLSAQEDHQRLLTLLHLPAIPPGASGRNPNTDEAKANPFPALPDPLVLKNGQPVTTPDQWWRQRRPEILEDFEREVYGRTPKVMPKVTWEVTSTTASTNGGVATVVRQLTGHVDNAAYPPLSVDIRATLTTPAALPAPAGAAGPVPVVIQMGPGTGGAPPTGARPPAPRPPGAPAAGPTWQQQVLARGWGYASLYTGSVQADNGAGLTAGIIGLVNHGQPRTKADDWGVLAAWSWGASRLLDYLETDPAVDAKRVALEGHSRWGKATLLAAALDPRFAAAYVSSSGEGGAKLHRRSFGELVENVAAANEYHWMAPNFLKYAGHWDALPVDSHELVALCAPRPVFIGAGTVKGDGWCDPRGSFMAAVGAGPVYKLLGKRDLGTAEYPAVETGLTTGELAFRQHAGGHTDGPNWPAFLEFAGRYFSPAAAPAVAPGPPAAR